MVDMFVAASRMADGVGRLVLVGPGEVKGGLMPPSIPLTDLHLLGVAASDCLRRLGLSVMPDDVVPWGSVQGVGDTEIVVVRTPTAVGGLTTGWSWVKYDFARGRLPERMHHWMAAAWRDEVVIPRHLAEGVTVSHLGHYQSLAAALA